MKISVLISTYNGEQFIGEQLVSLLNQTQKPDEVIIIDDCSTDKTIQIVQGFIDANCLHDKWKLYKNPTNLGWRINFIQGIQHVSGDALFYCDQDDIWFENKIEVFADILGKNTEINVLVSHEILWEKDQFVSEYRIENNTYELLELSAKVNNYLIQTSGCCMAIRMEYIKKVIKYCVEGWAHDDFFWKMGLLDGSLAYLNSSSILHRITGVNESRRKNNLQKTIWGINLDIRIAEKMLERLSYEVIQGAEVKRTIIQHKLKGTLLRKQMIYSKNPLRVIQLLMHYSDLYRRKRQLVGDYLRAIGIIK